MGLVTEAGFNTTKGNLIRRILYPKKWTSNLKRIEGGKDLKEIDSNPTDSINFGGGIGMKLDKLIFVLSRKDFIMISSFIQGSILPIYNKFSVLIFF